MLVNDLLHKNIIRPSNSEYASRVVLVPKRNKTHRLCIDYRALNKVILKDRFPLPIIEDCLDKLQGKNVFSLIDLKNGFFHIPIHADSIKYTSFITQDGQFEFVKCPFGLCNSPAVFQRHINQIVRPLIDDGSIVI